MIENRLGRLPAAGEENIDRDLFAAFRCGRADFTCIDDGDLDQSGIIEPPCNIAAFKSEPSVLLFCAQPFVSVCIGIGDYEPSSGFEPSRHLADRVRRIRGMVQNHIGEAIQNKMEQLSLATRAPGGGAAADCGAIQGRPVTRTFAAGFPAFVQEPGARRIGRIVADRLKRSAGDETRAAPEGGEF